MRVKDIGDAAIENNVIESTIEEILFLPNMKRFLALVSLFFIISVQALSGVNQIKVEWLYDTYRARYLKPLTAAQQVETLTRITSALETYKNKPTVNTSLRDMITYLQHLFCHTKSLLTGYYCEDTYYTPSLLTTNKKDLSLSQMRVLLIQEHSRRRVERGLWSLKESEVLNTIAQNYATELCKTGEITHTLNGSTLEQRYQNGNYNYSWGGENLGLGQENIMELLDQLTTSIGHRENMYQPEFTEIGLGQCDSIWVLNYGKP